MYLCYVDESGNRNIDKEKFFVLCSLSIKERSWKQIMDKLQTLLDCYNLPKSINFKHLRRMNYESTPFTKLSGEELKRFSENLYGIIRGENVKIHAIIIDKHKLKNRYIKTQEPYTLAYKYLIERISFLLQEANQYGIIILDELGGSRYQNWRRLCHEIFRDKGTDYMKIENIIETLFFNREDNSWPLQLADLCTYNIWKYLFDRDYYFFHLMEPMIYQNKEGKIEGYGLKYFPDD